MDFRKRIKELCQERGITQKELAEKMGITDISLNKTLRGEYPQLQTLEKIATVLNVPIAELFDNPRCSDEHTIVCPKCGTKFKMVEE
nr:helix-turn-helix transcriptional regulator [uncultured Bacteroides sp.]